MFRKIQISILLLLAGSGIAIASIPDSLSFHVQTFGVASSGELVPLWIHANQYGRIASIGKGQLGLRVFSNYQHELGNRLNLSLGVDGWISNDSKEQALGQAFLQLDYGKLSLIAGKKNLDYLQASAKEISFINFKSIRPMPALALGFLNYTNLPLTSGYVQFKACLLQGVLNDDRSPYGVDHPLYHFKNLYLRTRRLPVNLFMGLSHSVLFGGTTASGVKIPVDWVNTYLIKSSDKLMDIFPTDAVNKPGEHVGYTEVGLEYENKDVQLVASIENPCTDRSGLKTYKDMIFTLQVHFKKGKWLKGIQYQYGNFKYQSGPGLHLGHYHDEVEDYNAFMKENFGLETNINTWEEFYPYLIEYVNHGYPEFGRDNYFNHTIYKLSHSYDGHFFGYPLMHTSGQIAYFDGIDDSDYAFIGNNRIDAHHFFINGNLSRSLSYIARVGISSNYGTYTGYYIKDFEERMDYYFRGGKRQNYLSLELQKELPKQLRCNLNLGYDCGELYHSFGLMLTLTKSFF